MLFSLDVINLLCGVGLFTQTCAKLVAYHTHRGNVFLDSNWNRFEVGYIIVFIIVQFAAMLLGRTGEDSAANVIRIFSVAILAKLVVEVRGMRDIFIALWAALPNIMNIIAVAPPLPPPAPVGRS